MEDMLRSVLLTPAVVLSILVGSFHTCLYLFLRGRAGRQLLLILPAAVAGAWAGQALGARVGDILRLGDYSLLWASGLAWLGILVVTLPGQARGHGDADGEELRPGR